MNSHQQRYAVLFYALTCFVSTIFIFMLNEGALRLTTRTYENLPGFVLFFFLNTTIVIAASSFWRYVRSFLFGSYTPKSIVASICGVILAFGWWGLPILLQHTTQIDYYVAGSRPLLYCYGFMTFCVWVVISVECEAYLSIRRLTSVQRIANA